jgi:hypothetical protein
MENVPFQALEANWLYVNKQLYIHISLPCLLEEKETNIRRGKVWQILPRVRSWCLIPSLVYRKKRQRKDCYRQDIMWLHAQEGKIIRNGIKGTK